MNRVIRSLSTFKKMNLHDFTLNKLSGEACKLDAYAGRVVLMQNVATL